MTDFAADTAPLSDRFDPSDPADPSEKPDDIWALARELYAGGQTGQAVCMALGMRPSTFWRRAAQENWLRRDHPQGTAPTEPLDMSASVDDLATARDKAWRRVCLAMDQGRSAEAMRWIRVHSALFAQTQTAQEAIDRSAGRPSDYEPERPFYHAMRKVQADLQRMALGDRLEKVESTLTDSHTDRPAKGLDPNAPGLSRAERRRRLKYRAAHGPTPPPTDPARVVPP